MSDQLICIATFPSAGLASIALGRLEAEGIRAYLEGEAAAEMLWQMGPTISGVRLMVFEDQADKAIDVLESVQAQHVYDADPETDASEDDDDDDKDDGDSREPVEEGEQPAWLTRRRDATTRAWRAAIIGVATILCVPVLNIYSMYLLFRHGLLSEEPLAPPDWRISATMWLNFAVFVVWWIYMFAMMRSSAGYYG